ncbi:MAG: prolyl oligopeptidase family serine peptidase [Candidatus Obscuribacterales bacterium]
MKLKVVAGLLGLSALFNVAGLVFMIGYIDARGDVKQLKKQRQQIEQNLAMAQSSALAKERNPGGSPTGNASAPNPELERSIERKFASHLDGVEDQFRVLLPQWSGGPREYTLLVYLHGMGSTELEPFLVPSDTSIARGLTSVDRNTCIISCSCRKKQAWGNDAAVADITQNIRNVMYELPFKRIVICGTSMGGCTALNYAASAPPDIKEKISGIICVEGAGDVAGIYHQTHTDVIRTAMAEAFGGTPEQVPQVYAAKSFINKIDKVQAGTRFALVTTSADTVVPAALQMDVVQRLKATNHPVKQFELAGEHHVPPWTTFADAYRFVLNGS